MCIRDRFILSWRHDVTGRLERGVFWMAIDHPQSALAASKRGEEIYEFEDVDSRGSAGSARGSFGHTSWRLDCSSETTGGAAKACAHAATSSAQSANGAATAAASGAGSDSGAASVHRRGVERREYRRGGDGSGPVSYTHLDVYKRQDLHRRLAKLLKRDT